jgi:hypothetical protein
MIDRKGHREALRLELERLLESESTSAEAIKKWQQKCLEIQREAERNAKSSPFGNQTFPVNTRITEE